MSGIDIRSLLLPKHAQHVVLIHFPIALFLTGVCFDFAAYWTKRAAAATLAYGNLLLAGVFVVPVLASGIAAWQWQLAGQRLKGILLLHLMLGCLAGILICAVACIHFVAKRKKVALTLPAYRLPLELLTAMLVVAVGHLGGILSGVNT
jgi:uncharacterized membrane protein